MGYLNPAAGAEREMRTSAGAPVAGTDEVQRVTTTGVPTGGTFKLEFKGQRTAAIAWNAAAAAVVAALEALSTIGTGGVTATGGPLNVGFVDVTFAAAKGKQAQPLMTLVENALTGGTTPSVTIAEQTAGVSATHRGAPKGSKLVDTTNGIDYINTGTPNAPTWTKVGTQT